MGSLHSWSRNISEHYSCHIGNYDHDYRDMTTHNKTCERLVGCIVIWKYAFDTTESTFYSSNYKTSRTENLLRADPFCGFRISIIFTDDDKICFSRLHCDYILPIITRAFIIKSYLRWNRFTCQKIYNITSGSVVSQSEAMFVNACSPSQIWTYTWLGSWFQVAPILTWFN